MQSGQQLALTETIKDKQQLKYKQFKLLTPMQDSKRSKNIKITIRVRPLLPFEDEPAWLISSNQIKCMHSKAVKAKLNINTGLSNDLPPTQRNGNNTLRSNKGINQLDNYTYHFDNVVGDGVSSQRIYKMGARKLVEEALKDGKNCTFVTYGQTCSGKTFTLLGIKQAPGYIPCIFRDMTNMNSQQSLNCTFSISYIEIYNQKLQDLLNSSSSSQASNNLKITKDNTWGIQIQNITKISVKSFEDCLEVLDQGQNRRRYGQKLNHDKSSRSHTVMRIKYVEKWIQSEARCQRSIINIVDLAGSERLSKDSNENISNNGIQTMETGFINKSLFQFSNVIAKLSESQKSGEHITYRDSKLTRILQPSLNRDCNMSIIFCISPAVVNLGESISTLRLAVKAKSVQIPNTIIDNPEIKQIKKMQQLIQRQNEQINQLKQKITRYQKQVKKLQKQLSQKQSNQPVGKPIKNVSQSVNGFSGSTDLSYKMVILLDHQNFMINLNQTVGQISDNLSFDKHNKDNLKMIEEIKQDFGKQIGDVYQRYARKLVELAVGIGYDASWLHAEDICFCNIHYDKNALIQYKIPLLKQIKSQLHADQNQFSSILESYINKLTQQLYSSQHYMKQSSQNIHRLPQSPICQKSGLSLHTIKQMDEPQGKLLLSWGCKKQGRVFKNNNQQDKKHTDTFSYCSQFQNLKDISCGAHHTLVALGDGQLVVWGRNQNKQLGIEKVSYVEVPRLIGFNQKVVAVAAGWGHSLLLSQQGKVYTFGYGQDGQLGHGNNKSYTEPQPITMATPVSSIYAGHSHSGFIDIEQNYYAFGYNKDYRLMLSERNNINKPTKINLRHIYKASLGISHTCLLDKYGKVYSGGVGTNGQLGVELNPTITGYETIQVPEKNYEDSPIEKICPIVQLEIGDKRIIDVSCGECSTAVVTDAKQLYTFGKCSFDRLGHSSNKMQKILSNVDRVQMGYRHGFAWNSETKEVYGWGFNMYNQLGSIQAKDLKTPQLIQSLSSKQITKISTGFFHSAAIAK